MSCRLNLARRLLPGLAHYASVRAYPVTPSFIALPTVSTVDTSNVSWSTATDHGNRSGRRAIGPDEALSIVSAASVRVQPFFQAIDERTKGHVGKVSDAMRSHHVTSGTFMHAESYGNSDYGRETLYDV